MYRFHVVLLLPYIGIFVLMLIFHTTEIEASGICIIGLQAVASLPLVVFNLYMTLLFIRPLLKLSGGLKFSWTSSRLNEVAIRTLASSIVCLVVSFANIFVLVLLNDVTINVITVHWVTSQSPGSRVKGSGAVNSHQLSQLEKSHQRLQNETGATSSILQQLETHYEEHAISSAPPYSSCSEPSPIGLQLKDKTEDSPCHDGISADESYISSKPLTN
ncbi:hypothetical protein RO3G_16265 [Rhizopus delemar RA 99-880]|uniref:Uncharacterized protein n=1 Tax=Rhizopus delemar (strain RA 99-880 / ATCC MYA-4621 / FGSC 9543 / NRRL 43880) TaxID=246409 RepID=I1CSX4_RHIO9|nr:hypothetical protein RO3G_16265 [Rhizopus delemar RA 99-880]|eukprot:EIE91554.1 hypothetical protein RO3G_16265 [Rhizopus delemar RA 99-880]